MLQTSYVTSTGGIYRRLFIFFNFQDIALCAVNVLLIELQHNKDWNIAQTKEWIGKVAYFQNSIVSILNLTTLSDSAEAKYVSYKTIIVCELHYPVW